MPVFLAPCAPPPPIQGLLGSPRPFRKECDYLANQFLQIDHVVPLEAGGETNVHNTWRICPHHHFLKTYAEWTVIGEPGSWDLVPPDDPDP